MKIKELIEKIGSNKNIEDMYKLGVLLEESIYKIKDYDENAYCELKMKLYEMAYGKKLNQETAEEWVKSMQPVGQHWTINETTDAMRQMGYNLDIIDFYVVANMMYNDHYDSVRENEPLALKLAYEWLNDTDAKECKLYNYWKYITLNPKIL
jgi:hypothetical protein